ncbi:NAD(P)H-dependent oxidoreductase [Amycolatopsis sp. NBC_00345]|uniref:NADPH-dependent FMN reductase n=1 Tax=Amycolatopsis sp. NBC_00345 TaxID=2975955 RepID=UPI002E25C2DF
MTKLEIIVASTRPGRVGLPVAKWFEGEAKTHGGFDEVEIVDLAEVNLPFFNEAKHPRLREYEHQHTKDWSAKVAEADAFAFVMPEYNHGFNAELKNALDYLHHEWLYKAAGLVSYGGVAAGTRATQMIKPVLAVLRMTTVAEAVSIPFVQQFLEDGVIVPNDVMTTAVKAMLDELVRVAETLKPLRKDS